MQHNIGFFLEESRGNSPNNNNFKITTHEMIFLFYQSQLIPLRFSLICLKLA
jgi:hypothetical protein